MSAHDPPTVARITPATGPTGGRRIVKIWGGGFQLLPEPVSRGVVPNPSVEVLFGDVPARDVRVMATSLLHVVTPIHDAGTVSITIRNIDQAGVPLAGEGVTIPNAYTFARPVVGSGEAGEQSNLTRLVRTIVEELRRQILPNVVLTTHTDYDDTPDGANVAALAKVPGLVLSGPILRLNRFYATNQAREDETTEGETYVLRPSRTVDVAFTIIGVDELMTRNLDLINECTAFFLRNTTLRMARSVAAPSDVVEYELEIDDGGDFKSVGTANNSNIRAFSGSFLVRGFNIDDDDMRAILASPIADVLGQGEVGNGGGDSGASSDGTATPSPITFASSPTGDAGHIAQFTPEE